MYTQVPTIVPRVESTTTYRFPAVEVLLGADSLVHDCWVTVVDGSGLSHRFLVSCTFKPGASVNYALKSRFPDLLSWPGDLLVMAMGLHNRVIGLRGDAQLALADAAVRKYVARVPVILTEAKGNNVRFLTHVQNHQVVVDGIEFPFGIPTDID